MNFSESTARSFTSQPYCNNSSAIRQEIQRFESVHPSIYAIYDLLEALPDQILAQQLREHVVCIEDSFVNSQEWTLSRTVPDLRLGILGSLVSGKSALVHRYLTGSYLQDESPEGGRFKKEVVVDDQSYLLLIRDEGGLPQSQFCCWVDAVVIVFSLENESSFNEALTHYRKLCNYRSDIPVILVGTQDAISESNPRIIDDNRARKLAFELKRCPYYETCATYGLNVERVFQDACQKIVDIKRRLTPANSRPATPVTLRSTASIFTSGHSTLPSNGVNTNGSQSSSAFSASSSHGPPPHSPFREATIHFEDMKPPVAPSNESVSSFLPAIISTPTTSRKNRRRSNLFTPLKSSSKDAPKNGSGEVGSGRVIPIKQGYLYKRSVKALNKEWKKKYVALTSDGRLTYYSNIQDYMENTHAKEISLMRTTVKIPGQKPRGCAAGGEPHSMIGGNHIIDSTPSSTPAKKRGHHRRTKSVGKNLDEDSDGGNFEFLIVSLDNKQWHFEASSCEERESWVTAIEQQILSTLQGNDSAKGGNAFNSQDTESRLLILRNQIPGNTHCADCDAPGPDWASLNIGALICIECSGVHRNLGSHISRVRSLNLDDWSPEHMSVMMALGNTAANAIWEANRRGRAKPTPNSSREEKERWIRSKYEHREFLPPIPVASRSLLNRRLIEAVSASNVSGVALALAQGAEPDSQVDPISDKRRSLHLAATLGNLPIVQLLIWYKADVNATDSEGRTPLLYCTFDSVNGGAIKKVLLNHGARHAD